MRYGADTNSVHHVTFDLKLEPWPSSSGKWNLRYACCLDMCVSLFQNQARDSGDMEQTLILYMWPLTSNKDLEFIKLVAKKVIKCLASLTFYHFSPTHLINSIKHEHSCKIPNIKIWAIWRETQVRWHRSASGNIRGWSKTSDLSTISQVVQISLWSAILCYIQVLYSKTCLKRPLKNKTKIGFQDRLSHNAGQKYCRMFRGEHSAILLTFIKLPFLIKIFVLSIFEWLLKTGFTVCSR